MFITNYGADSQMMTLLTRNLNEKVLPFQLHKADSVQKKVTLDSSALFIFGSLNNLRKFNNKLTLTNQFYKPLQLFIFCEKATSSDIESLVSDISVRDKPRGYATEVRGNKSFVPAHFKMEFVDVIQYEYFLIEEAQDVYLMTFVWYSPKSCGKLKLIKINTFSKRSKNWVNNNFSLDKLANFYGCEITCLTSEYAIGSNFHRHIPVVLQTHLNYKLSYWDMNVNPDDRVDVAFNKACYNAYDGNVFVKGITEHMNKPVMKQRYFRTQPVEFSPVHIAVPPGGNFSEYEKLRMPFDDNVWVLITITFATAFTVIFISYFMSQRTQDFIIGSNITTPSLNVAQIFFGIAQVAVPRRNFARFLVMVFILYSLIIRTAWQGKTYEFMQKNISKPEVQTIDEMINHGYAFYMERTFKFKYPDSKIVQRTKVLDIYTNLETLFNGILDPTFRGVMQVDTHLRENLTKRSHGLFLKRIRNAVLSIDMCGMRFVLQHHFMGIFERKSQQLFTGGLTPHEDNGSLTYKNNYKLTEAHFKHLYVVGPKVLTFKMLEPGFVIWSVSLAIAVLAFVTEWLMTLRNYLIIKYVMIAFYCTKKESLCRKKTTVPMFIEAERHEALFGYRKSISINLDKESFQNSEAEQTMSRASSIEDLLDSFRKMTADRLESEPRRKSYISLDILPHEI